MDKGMESGPMQQPGYSSGICQLVPYGGIQQPGGKLDLTQAGWLMWPWGQVALVPAPTAGQSTFSQGNAIQPIQTSLSQPVSSWDMGQIHPHSWWGCIPPTPPS